MPHIVKASPPNKSLALLAAIVACLILIIALQSCNTLKRAEAKALKPYVVVLSDVDTGFKKKKQDLLAAIVDAKMPNKPKKETITKYLPGATKIVKDTAGLLKLANYYEKQLQGKICVTGKQLDSIISFNRLEPTTIYKTDTIYNGEKETIIDTTGNYYKNQELILLRKNYNECESDMGRLIKASKELLDKQNNWSYSAKLFFGNTWDAIKWWLLGIVLLYGGYKLLKSKFTLPFSK